MKNAKIWIYPLSVYLAAAVLFSIGCADDNKNKRVSIKASPNRGGGERNQNLADDKEDPKTVKEVKALFDKSSDPVAKATSQSKADEIEKLSKSVVTGEVTAAENIEVGNYKVKLISLSGEIATKKGGFLIHLLSEFSDLNNLPGAKNTFSSTSKEPKEKAEATSKDTDTEESKETTKNRKNRKKLSAAEQEQNRREGRENRKLKAANAEKKNEERAALINALAAKAFIYNYGFGRMLKFTKEGGLEDQNAVQINAYMKPGAREMKVGYSNLGTGALNDVKAVSLRDALANSKLIGDNTYECTSGDKCILSFRQDKSTNELQVTIREEHNSKDGSGTRITKIITIVYTKTDSGETKKEKTPEEKSRTPETQFTIPNEHT